MKSEMVTFMKHRIVMTYRQNCQILHSCRICRAVKFYETGPWYIKVMKVQEEKRKYSNDKKADEVRRKGRK